MREKTYRIGEAADMLRLKSYVLRFWETEFPHLAPLRTDKGQRLYPAYHIALLHRIRQLLHEQGMTIEGARRVLASAARGEVPLVGLGPQANPGQATHAMATQAMGVQPGPAGSAAGYAPSVPASGPTAGVQTPPYGGQGSAHAGQAGGGDRPTAPQHYSPAMPPQAGPVEDRQSGQSGQNGQGIDRNVVREMREELLALRNMLTAED